ncbi:MAG: glycosyltransferase [Candidatus Omnitrophica bacterium]|nr:glycosyltransferase [Candidatus Omnitrophota bacterium]
MLQAKVLVVVPCYNEEKRLSKKSYQEFISCYPNYRFLFVDDGSKDNTFSILDSLRREKPDRYDILKLEQNSGKAEAVRQGFLKGIDSGVEFLAFWDADLATPLALLPHFSALFTQLPSVEIVLGSRIKLMGRDVRRHALRHYLGRIFATCASAVLKLEVYDTQCGAKMFRNTETLRAIFQAPFKSKWIFDVELLARYLKTRGCADAESRIYELPLQMWYDIAGSKVKAVDFFKAFGELFQIYTTYRN